MKNLIILALLLLPAMAIAQTQDLPCPGSVTNTFVGGYVITTTCSMGGVVPPPPPSDGVTATFLGADLDKLGILNNGPDGVLDYHINVQGLPATTVTKWRITTASGVWENPFNGTNWNIFVARSGASADLWLSKYDPAPFNLTIFFSDGAIKTAGGIR